MMILFLTALFGLIVGSFVTVVIDRLPEGRSIIAGRSRCDRCKTRLRAIDLIPVISYFMLRGKSHCCKRPISYHYPLFELIHAGLWLLVVKTGMSRAWNWESMVISCGILSVLMMITIIDARHRIIPDELVMSLGVLAVLHILTTDPGRFVPSILSGAGLMAVFYGLHAITRGKGMGLGDVKLSGALGVLSGYPNVILLFYLAFLTGAGVSLILMMAGVKKLKGTIAFGPFLCVSSGIVLLWGDEVWVMVRAATGL